MANSSGRNNEISSSPYFNGGGAGVGSQFQPLAIQPERPLGSSVGYAAFGNYEREVRQRKYMIAECDDTFGGPVPNRPPSFQLMDRLLAKPDTLKWCKELCVKSTVSHAKLKETVDRLLMPPPLPPSSVEKTLPLPNERGRGVSNSTTDTNATTTAQASTNNGGTPGSFSSLFSIENESASTSSGFFDYMDFFGNSSAATDKNDVFGSASTTNSNQGGDSNPKKTFNFHFSGVKNSKGSRYNFYFS